VGRDRTFALNLLNINELKITERAIVAKMSLELIYTFLSYHINTCKSDFRRINEKFNTAGLINLNSLISTTPVMDKSF
jgi:hypothetical protein